MAGKSRRSPEESVSRSEEVNDIRIETLAMSLIFSKVAGDFCRRSSSQAEGLVEWWSHGAVEVDARSQ